MDSDRIVVVAGPRCFRAVVVSGSRLQLLGHLRPNDEHWHRTITTPTAAWHFSLTLSVQLELGLPTERTLLGRCVPLSSLSDGSLPVFPVRGPPQPQAAPELCGSQRCSEGLGWSVGGGANKIFS